MNILDSSVVILFLYDIDAKRYLELLKRDGENFSIPESVYDEILDDNTQTKLDYLIVNGIIQKIYTDEDNNKNQIMRRFPALGNGEINVLVCARHMKETGSANFICVIDESPGRKAAKKLGLPLTGSIGLIKMLKKKQLINKLELQQLVDAIRQSPFFVCEETLREVLSG